MYRIQIEFGWQWCFEYPKKPSKTHRTSLFQILYRWSCSNISEFNSEFQWKKKHFTTRLYEGIFNLVAKSLTDSGFFSFSYALSKSRLDENREKIAVVSNIIIYRIIQFDRTKFLDKTFRCFHRKFNELDIWGGRYWRIY